MTQGLIFDKNKAWFSFYFEIDYLSSFFVLNEGATWGNLMGPNEIYASNVVIYVFSNFTEVSFGVFIRRH